MVRGARTEKIIRRRRESALPILSLQGKNDDLCSPASGKVMDGGIFIRMGKRTLAGLLAAAMLAAVAPVTAFAAGADTGKAIQLVDESNPTGGISGWDSTAGYDFIYFGDFSGPIKWRVLDTKTNMENAKVGDGLFLLSDVLLGRGSTGFVYFDDSGNQSNAWQYGAEMV